MIFIDELVKAFYLIIDYFETFRFCGFHEDTYVKELDKKNSEGLLLIIFIDF